MKKLTAATMAASVLLGAGAARAQQSAPLPPQVDPGAIGRGLIDNRRDLPPPRLEVSGDAITGDPTPAAGADAPANAAITVEVREITFDPSAFLNRDELSALAQPLIGTRASLADLRALATRVNALYAARGIVTARAYVPPQRVENGTVRIALIEGKLGNVQFAKGRYTSDAFARSRIDLKPGEVVDMDLLRRQVNRFNRNNDARLQAQLQPGAQVGLTDVALTLVEPPRNSVQLFLDTYGYESTGRLQGGVALRRNGLLFDGDRANIYASASEGGLTGSASYNVAVGLSRIGATYARSQITVKNGPSANLDIDGFSDSASVNFARPIAEGNDWYANFVAAAAYVASENRLSNRTVGESKVYKATAGIGFGMDLPRGSFGLNLTGSPTKADDTLEPAGRKFVLVNGDFAGLIGLGNSRLALRVTGAGQYVGSDFIPSNQLFQIGGPVSIRGFQPGSASGSNGYYTQAELHYQTPLLGRTLDAFTFFDSGKTFSQDFGDRALGSVGFGARLPFWRFDLETTLGLPVTTLRPGEDSYRIDARLLLSF